MKYRKKPVEIEARQLTINNMALLADWCDGVVLCKKPRIEIDTATGSIELHE